MQALNEPQQTLLQAKLAGFWQFDETEGLEPALSGPHGKHHFCLFADGGLPEVKNQLDLQFFVERLLDVHQAAGDGKLMQFSSYLAPVGQAHQRQDRSAKLDPKRTTLATRQS